MIRPAVITDEITQDFERALDVMLQYGVKSAELRGLWGRNVLDLDKAELHRAKEALERRGMTVCSIASPFMKCKLRPDGEASAGPLHLAVERGLDEQMTVLDRAIELCRYFGTDLVRGFAFWNQDELSETVWAEIETAFRAPVALVEREGIISVPGVGGRRLRRRRVTGDALQAAQWQHGGGFAALPAGHAAPAPGCRGGNQSVSIGYKG
jgi:sugar phosphate isomerase/epimerase